jgi:Domain of unknown function (DUF3644)
MKREARLLKVRAVGSLLLAIELFNRPSEIGRQEAVLLHADHAMELLLKAIIVHKGGRIRRSGEIYTLKFGECVNKCVSEAQVSCLSESGAVALCALHGWRDAAQHYFLELPESQLYLAAQGAVTLFDDLLKKVFHEPLARHLPERVLPVSTRPPTDLDLMLDETFSGLAALIGPRVRRMSEAKARLRPVAILEAANRGDDAAPSEADLRRSIKRLRDGEDWRTVFPGVASLRLDTSGTGLTFSLHLTKKDGLPVTRVGEGEGAPLAERRVNELDFYSLGLYDLARRLAPITVPKLGAVIEHLGLKGDDQYYKEFLIGKTRHCRYSRLALERLRAELPALDADAVWAARQAARRRPR